MADDTNKKGFAGLVDLASDISGIDEPIKSALKEEKDFSVLIQPPMPQTPSAQPPAPKPLSQKVQPASQTNSRPNRLFNKPRLILFAMGTIAVVWYTTFLSMRDTTPSVYYYSSEYYTMPGLKNPASGNRIPIKPYIKGKIVPIEKGKVVSTKKVGWIDEAIYNSLPEDIRATKPDEVGTVVWLDRGEDMLTCRVIIIDKSLVTIVKKINFKGATETIVNRKIVNYLKNLPKK
jgi:hypothetical protein